MKNVKFGKFAVLGDSYSTFKGVIPKHYATCYGEDCWQQSGITKAAETWWGIIDGVTDSELVVNNSYSGSTICNTGYEGKSARFTSYVSRIKWHFIPSVLPLDTIFVFGGTNDCWAGAPLGEIKTENRTDKDLFSFLPAVCEALEYFKTNYPSSRIIVIINCDLTEPYTNGLKEAAKIYNCEWVQLEKIDKVDAHPTLLGMKQIAEQICEKLR